MNDILDSPLVIEIVGGLVVAALSGIIGVIVSKSSKIAATLSGSGLFLWLFVIPGPIDDTLTCFVIVIASGLIGVVSFVSRR